MLSQAAIITVVITALLAGVLSRWMWGYWFTRPGVDVRALGASMLLSVTPVVPEAQPNGTLELVPAPAPLGIADWETSTYAGPGWYDHALFANQSDYYLLDLRLLRALEQCGTATSPRPALPATRLAGLMPFLEAAGVFAKDSPGYQQWKPGMWNYSGGFVYEFLWNGRLLLLVALRGGEVSNDHHPYYELLLAPSVSGPPQILSSNRFFFDVAGIEGAEFPSIFRALALIGLLTVVPATGLTLTLGWLNRRKARLRGCCQHCGYDLQGLDPGPCPECGRAASPAADISFN